MRNEPIYSGQMRSILFSSTHPINSLDIEESPRKGSHHEQLSAWKDQTVRLYFIIIIMIMLGLGLLYQPRQASLDLKYRRCSEKMMMRLKHLQN